MQTIEILGKEYELFCSTSTAYRIAETCGGISNMGKWLKQGDNPDDNLDDNPEKTNPTGTTIAVMRVAQIIAILIDGAVQRNNYGIMHGLIEGQKAETIGYNGIINILTPGEIISCRDKIFMAVAEGMAYEIPEGVKVKQEETDKVLEEIKEKRAKKAVSAE